MMPRETNRIPSARRRRRPGRGPRRWAAAAGALALPAALLLAQAGLAWAETEGAEAHGDPLTAFFWRTFNFLVLVGLLWYFLRKPVRRVLSDMARRTRQTVTDARDSAAEMERKHEDQRKNIENLRSELERLRDEARAETTVEAERLKHEAQAAADRMTADVRIQVTQARQKALLSIRDELADEAVKLAEGRIKDQLDENAQKRLLDRQVEEQERAL